MAKVKEMDLGTTERASILFRCIALNGEATNIQNMMFMKKGDAYMEYCKKVKKVDYPSLRAAIEKDLGEAPTQVVDGISRGKATKITVFPWGTMSIKAKAHSLAVSMLKTYQRRSLKFDKDHNKLSGVTLFSKYSKYGTPEAEQVNKAVDVTYKSVHKAFDEKRALDFLNSFLTPAPAVKAVRKAA